MVSGIVVLGFSFGKPARIMPNEIIAREMKRYDLPLVADRSIPLSENDGRVHFIGPTAEVHAPTLVLTDEFAALAKTHGWNRVLVLSEPNYLRRCKRDLIRSLKTAGVECKIILAEIELRRGESWFDLQCKQWWTRYKWLFRFREFVTQLLPFPFYKWLSYW